MLKRTTDDPTLYLAAWDLLGVVKFGHSKYRRWTYFPHARLVVALPFPDMDTCRGFELDLHYLASRTWDRAFSSAAEAAIHLGQEGGGWTECYRAPVGEAVELLAFGCHDGMTRHCDDALPRHACTEKDGLTDGDLGFCRSSKLLTVTCANTRQNFAGGVR